MYKSIIALGVLCAAALPFAVQASDQDSDPGWYVGLSGGISNYGNFSGGERATLAGNGISTAANADDHASTFAIGGGYQFNRYVALEANYLDLGQPTADIFVTSPPPKITLHETMRAKGETLDAIGLLPISDSVSVFLKGGLFVYELDRNITFDPSTEFSDSGTGATWDLGLGVDLRFSQTWGMRAGLTEYHYLGVESTTGKVNVGLAYAQVLLHF